MAKRPTSRSSFDPEAVRDNPISQGKNYLLTIGIDEYEHCAKLNNAVGDARDLVRLLQAKYQFETERSFTCYNGDATWEGIDQAFDHCAETIEAPDNLVIYFSGHGHYEPKTGGAYWIPSDARYQRVRDYYSYDRITRRLKTIESQHTFLIVDSCYSGAVLIRDVRSGINRLERDPSRWILASGRNEVVPDGEAGGHSPFASQLLDVLNRYAGDHLPVMELVTKVTTAVVHNARQTPIGCPLRDVGDKGGQFIFWPKSESLKTKKPSIQSMGYGLPQMDTSANHNNLLKVHLKMIPIPSATFQMGSLGSEEGRFDGETIHEVSLSAYELAETPVTVAAYLEFVQATDSHHPAWIEADRENNIESILHYRQLGKALTAADHPIVGVSWNDAIAYCHWLSEQTGNKYCLPTEAEWEYAAAGGTEGYDEQGNRQFIWAGTSDEKKLSEYAWFASNADNKTHPVGQKVPNPLGLFDMSGNVWEWCADWYGRYPKLPQHDPNGPNLGDSRVLRGGNWYDDPSGLRIAYRFHYTPFRRDYGIGFRLARKI